MDSSSSSRASLRFRGRLLSSSLPPALPFCGRRAGRAAPAAPSVLFRFKEAGLLKKPDIFAVECEEIGWSGVDVCDLLSRLLVALEDVDRKIAFALDFLG